MKDKCNNGVYGYQNGNYAGHVYGGLFETHNSGGSGTIYTFGSKSIGENTGPGIVYGAYNQALSSGTNGYNNYGVYATAIHTSTSTAPNTYGVYATGSTNNSSIWSFGVAGYGYGTGANTYGIYGASFGTGTNNYGVFGTAAGATNNWAGFFSGNFYYSGAFVAPSDEKLKQNIQGMEGALDMIMKLNPSTYEYKTTEYADLNLSAGTHYGFTAQGVQKVLPQLVKEVTVPSPSKDKNSTTAATPTTHLAVNYIEVIPVLAKAIQEQQTIINDLKARIVALEAKVK